jgi:hypothetical protein
MSGVGPGYIIEPFRVLIDDLNDINVLTTEKPFLAHYTSMQVLSRILETEEIWLSNPLFMNDTEEMRFGLEQGRAIFKKSPLVKEACGTSSRLVQVQSLFSYWYDAFERERSLDIYVFCLSGQDRADNDGILSMWRAYGAQGSGAALVFNTKQFEADKRSPLMIAKVRYSDYQERFAAIAAKLQQWCEILKNESIPDDQLDSAAFALFSAFLILSLVTKHRGFREEQEWRVIYMPELDPDNRLSGGFHYIIGNRGAEPKLRIKLDPPSISPRKTWTLLDLIEKIIIGPTISSVLAERSVLRMLDLMGKTDLASKVFSSSIPLRPT